MPNYTFTIVFLVIALALSLMFWRHLVIKQRRRVFALQMLSEGRLTDLLSQLAKDKPEDVYLLSQITLGGVAVPHLVVTPRGVFYLEAFSHPLSGKYSNQSLDLRVHADRVIFPDGEDLELVTRFKAQVRQVQTGLSELTGKPLGVAGVLVFPGWQIERKQNVGGMFVVNLDELKANLHRFQIASLSEEEIAEIRQKLQSDGLKSDGSVEPVKEQ